MSFSSWIDARIAAAIEKAVPMLVSALTAGDGPLIQTLATTLTRALVDALLGPITSQVGTLATSIPGAVVGMVSTELNQLPGQVKGVLDIPGEVTSAVGAAVAGLPAEIVNAIKGIIPIPFGETKK